MTEVIAENAIYWLGGETWHALSAETWLGAEERQVLVGLRLPKRRHEWLLGRWVAKRALRLAGLLPAALPVDEPQILAAADGAPEVFACGTRLPLTLSITHRDNCAVCMVVPGAVRLGCDLELIEPRSDAFVRDYFTTEEQRLVERVGTASRSLLATALIWSAKESLLKALRTGLRRDTRTVGVEDLNPEALCPTDAWQPLTVRDITGGARYHGHWRTLERLVLTVVSAPPSAAPTQLSPDLARPESGGSNPPTV